MWAASSPIKGMQDFLRNTISHSSNYNYLLTTPFYTGENAQPQSFQVNCGINIPVNYQRFNLIPVIAHIEIGENNLPTDSSRLGKYKQGFEVSQWHQLFRASRLRRVSRRRRWLGYITQYLKKLSKCCIHSRLVQSRFGGLTVRDKFYSIILLGCISFT